MYLYRAVDSSRQTLDFMLSDKRDTAAATRFLKKALNAEHTVAPRVINVDKNAAYPPAVDGLQASGTLPEDTELSQCQLLYLPPYSPDYNKIEHCWSWIKARIRHCIEQFDSLQDAMDAVLKQAS